MPSSCCTPFRSLHPCGSISSEHSTSTVYRLSHPTSMASRDRICVRTGRSTTISRNWSPCFQTLGYTRSPLSASRWAGTRHSNSTATTRTWSDHWFCAILALKQILLKHFNPARSSAQRSDRKDRKKLFCECSRMSLPLDSRIKTLPWRRPSRQS